MAIRGMEFSAESVTGLLDGLKTMTRRCAVSEKGRKSALLSLAPGDRVYVREPIDWDPGRPPATYLGASLREGARAPVEMARKPQDWAPRGEKTTGRYMPKWAGRLILTVADVSCEPVREISREDALCEGIVSAAEVAERLGAPEPQDDYFAYYGLFRRGRDGVFHAPPALRRPDPVRAYAALWDVLHRHAGRRFADNPDVAAVRFCAAVEHACPADLEDAA